MEKKNEENENNAKHISTNRVCVCLAMLHKLSNFDRTIVEFLLKLNKKNGKKKHLTVTAIYGDLKAKVKT